MADRACLVVGGAACVWADVEAALELGGFAGVVGCNTVGISWPGVMDAWVSVHAPELGLWALQRERRGLPPHRQVLTHKAAPESEPKLSPRLTGFVDHRFPGQPHSGSSGLFALKVALIDLGFERAVVCGMPMDDAASHIRDTSKPWIGGEAHRPGWREALPHIAQRARSMGGWTQELLGAPSPAWIATGD